MTPKKYKSVERAVKMVNEALAIVCGEEMRHEHIVGVNAKDYKVD